MAREQKASPHSALIPLPGTPVSYRIEQHHELSCGYFEVRVYHWSRPVEDVMLVEDDEIIINMALTPRPAHTRVAPTGKAGRHEPEDIGRIFVIMPGSSFHLSAPTGSVRTIHLALATGKFEELLGERPEWAGKGGAMELSGFTSGIAWLLNRIYQELREKQFGHETAVEAYAEALSIELARRLRSSSPVQPELHKGGLAPWRMRLLRERVTAEAPAPRLEELAELCGLTVRQLSRAFSAETGMSLGRFVDQATMERAHRLLEATDLTIAEIAADLGFASANSFAQAFRRSQGVPPSEIRRR